MNRDTCRARRALRRYQRPDSSGFRILIGLGTALAIGIAMRDVFNGPVTTNPQTAREAAWDALWSKRDEEALDLYAEVEASQLRLNRLILDGASPDAVRVEWAKGAQLRRAWQVSRERANRVLGI